MNDTATTTTTTRRRNVSSKPVEVAPEVSAAVSAEVQPDTSALDAALSGEHNPPTDLSSAPSPESAESLPEAASLPGDAPFGFAHWTTSELLDKHAESVAAESEAKRLQTEIETVLAQRLIDSGIDGAFLKMRDGKAYGARKYGDNVKGPMKGRVILVEKKQGPEFTG